MLLVKDRPDSTLRLSASPGRQKARSLQRPLHENVRIQIRVWVKRILRKHGNLRDKQEKTTQTVLEQAEVLWVDWAA